MPPPSTRRVYLQINRDIYDLVRKAAEEDRRSLSNWLSVTIERAVKDEAPGRAES